MFSEEKTLSCGPLNVLRLRTFVRHGCLQALQVSTVFGQTDHVTDQAVEPTLISPDLEGTKPFRQYSIEFLETCHETKWEFARIWSDCFITTCTRSFCFDERSHLGVVAAVCQGLSEGTNNATARESLQGAASKHTTPLQVRIENVLNSYACHPLDMEADCVRARQWENSPVDMGLPHFCVVPSFGTDRTPHFFPKI